MQKYADDVSILDDDSNIVPLSSASVTVYHAGTTTAASIFSDDGVTPTSNPLTTAEDGSFEFYAANGKYDILIEKSPYKPHHENGILLDDSSVVISGSVSSVISADTSLATRMSSADSVVLSSSDSADVSVVTRLSTVDSSNISSVASADTSLHSRLSATDSENLSTNASSVDSVVTREDSTIASVDTSIVTRMSTADSVVSSNSDSADVSVVTQVESVQTSADTSVVTRLLSVDSANLSVAISAADSASGAGGVSQSYVDSADTSVVSRLSIDDSANLSTAISAADSAASVGGGASTSYVDSADVSVVTKLSTVDSENLSTAQSAAASAASASSKTVNNINEHRLTLESGVPISSTDQTAKTILYFTPYVGNIISLYSGTAWEDKTFTEIHIDLTETQSCTTVNGDATLTVADTSQLIVGMEVSGTGIAGGATIASITDATHLEMSANATADATNNIVFKIPASKVVDVFAYNAAGSAKLVFGPLWTNATTRATALTTKDGVPVLTGSYSISGTVYTEGKLKWIGTVGTTATAGQTEDSETGRYVWNKYNKVNKKLKSYNSDFAWTISGVITAREYQNGTNQVRAKFIVGESQQFLITMNSYCWSMDTSMIFGAFIGVDNTTTRPNEGGTFAIWATPYGPLVGLGPGHANEIFVAGYHFITQCEYSAGSTGNIEHAPAGGLNEALHTTYWG